MSLSFRFLCFARLTGLPAYCMITKCGQPAPSGLPALCHSASDASGGRANGKAGAAFQFRKRCQWGRPSQLCSEVSQPADRASPAAGDLGGGRGHMMASSLPESNTNTRETAAVVVVFLACRASRVKKEEKIARHRSVSLWRGREPRAFGRSSHACTISLEPWLPPPPSSWASHWSWETGTGAAGRQCAAFLGGGVTAGQRVCGDDIGTYGKLMLGRQ